MIPPTTLRPMTIRAPIAARPVSATALAALPAARIAALALALAVALAAATLAVSPAAHAAAAVTPAAAAAAAGAAPAPATAAAAPRARQLGQYSGFEGRELELGRLVAAALRDASPAATAPGVAAAGHSAGTGAAAPGPDARYDFTGREALLGLAMTQLVRTLNHNQSYQHEMNDALVKMTLDHIMFAKRNGLLKQMVDEDIHSQRQQLERVRKLIERTGNRDLAIVGIFEQTACFFQLVDRTERAPGRVTYRSPYRTVLAQTVRMGIHDLSEREIHETWTIPRMQAYARVLGVELDVTPWREDGMVTVSVRGGA
jgi:hypothetical protein